jgi:hypothetical protein
MNIEDKLIIFTILEWFLLFILIGIYSACEEDNKAVSFLAVSGIFAIGFDIVFRFLIS